MAEFDAKKEPTFQVDDMVEFTRRCDTRLPGEQYRITYIGDDSTSMDGRSYGFEKGSLCLYPGNHFKLVETEFKVGDIVELNGNAREADRRLAGKPRKIVSIQRSVEYFGHGHGYGHGYTVGIDASDFGWGPGWPVGSKDIKLVTAEEPEDSKAATESVTYTYLERTPMFNVGDKVKVGGICAYSGYEAEIISVKAEPGKDVYNPSGYYSFRIANGGTCSEPGESLTLIKKKGKSFMANLEDKIKLVKMSADNRKLYKLGFQDIDGNPTEMGLKQSELLNYAANKTELVKLAGEVEAYDKAEKKDA